MKTTVKLILCIAIGLFSVDAYSGEEPVLKTLMDKMSYSIGVNLIHNFRQQGIDLDIDMIVKGMRDASSGKNLLMTEQDIHMTMSALQNELKQKQRNERGMSRVAYAFLNENKKKEGVVVLPSGLQYKIIKAGNGKKPTDADTVEVNYKGTHIDGTEFDSSYRRGKPATLKVSGGVVAGLSEALKLMPAGSTWQIFIPPHLAYGDKGLSPDIRPFETLIYEVELLGIK